LNTADFATRTIVEIEAGGDALERLRRVFLARHGGEQKPERRLDILAIDAAILLVSDPRTVIDHAEQHQRRHAGSIGIDPWRRRELLQVGRAHVEVPGRVRLLGLESHRRWLARHPVVVVAKTAHVPVERRGRQAARRQLLQAIGRLDAVVDEKLENTDGGEMAALPVGGAHLHGGDDFAPSFDLSRGHDARGSPIGTGRIAGTAFTAQQPVKRRAADPIQFGGRRQERPALGMVGGQCGQPAAERRERLDRHRGARRPHEDEDPRAW
jgi:hypothetical protein